MKWFCRKKEKPEVVFAQSEEKLTVKERGSLAKSVLDNPIFEEAFNEIKEETLRQWEGTKVSEEITREFLWSYLRALYHIHNRLQSYVGDAIYQDGIEKERQAEQME